MVGAIGAGVRASSEATPVRGNLTRQQKGRARSQANKSKHPTLPPDWSLPRSLPPQSFVERRVESCGCQVKTYLHLTSYRGWRVLARVSARSFSSWVIDQLLCEMPPVGMCGPINERLSVATINSVLDGEGWC